MPEQEELKLVVTLDDQASAKLVQLQEQLAKLSKQPGLESLGKGAEGSTRELKLLEGSLVGAVTKGTFFGEMLTEGAKKLIEFGKQVYDDVTNVEKLSRSMVELSNSAYRMGTSTAQLKSNLAAFRETGVPVEQATKNLQGFNDKMADLSLINGQLRGSLLSGGFLEIPRMLQLLERSDTAATPQEQIKLWADASKEVRQFWTAAAGPQEGARRQREFEAAIGAPDISRLRRQLGEVASWQKDLFERRDRGAENYLEKSERASIAWERILESTTSIIGYFSTGWLDKVVNVLERWQALNERSDYQLRRGPEIIEEKGMKPKGWWDTIIGGYGRSDVAARELGYGGYPMPKGGLPVPGTAAPMKFSGGSVQGGEWDSSNFTGSGGAYWKNLRGRSDVDIEDRRGLDDNTDQTKALTEQLRELNDNLTTPGRGGAAMPGSMAAALGYNNIGGGGGGGATMANRGAFAPGGVPGGGGGGGGGAPGGGGDMPITGASGAPSAILAKAQEVALQGGPGAVQQFMASQGYPKAGNWCGEFAAAVVKSAGGTPPANPQVASNWRNWGTKVDIPQPGDIAVANRGVRTGATGSHVTFVQSVGQGTFQGIGGNQGRTVSNFPTGGYQFFRGSGAEAQPGIGAAGGMGGAGGGLDRGAYDKMFAGTPLAGKYDAVVEAARANGVPPSLMAAVMAHETGRGTSNMLRTRNNPAGLMDPATGMATGKTFGNLDEGIAAAGRAIAKNYARGGSTITGMAGFYAPPGAANDPRGLNQSWPSGVAGYQRQLAGAGGGAYVSTEVKRRMGYNYDPDTGQALRAYDPFTGARTGGGDGGGAQRVWPSSAIRAVADQSRALELRQQINAAHAEQLRTFGERLGSEAAPHGGAEDPRMHALLHGPRGGEAAPHGGMPRPRGAPGIRGFPRTPGVGGEAAPHGGMPEPADVKARRMREMQEQRFTELHDIERRQAEVTEQQRTKEMNERALTAGGLVGRAPEPAEDPDVARLRREDREREHQKTLTAGRLIGRGPDLDKDSQNITVTGKGQLQVDVNAPPGTRVSGKGAGLLKDTSISRSTQMAPASSGSKEPAGIEAD